MFDGDGVGKGGPAARFASLRAFRHRSYVHVWIGAFISNVGTWMETLALGVFVTELTGKEAWTGAVAALMYLPSLVLGPLGGALADRFDRRRYVALVVVLQTFFAGLLAGLAFAHQLTLPAAVILAFLTGCAKALVDAAFGALLSDLVPREDLMSALSLSTANFNLGRIFGPMLAAAVMVIGGVSWAFLCNAVSFLAVIVAVLPAQMVSYDVPRKVEPLWDGIRTGLKAARDDRGIRMMLLLTLATSLLISPFVGLVPAYAINVFNAGAAGASLLATWHGVGALTSAVLLGAIAQRLGDRRMILIATIVLGPLAMAYWLSPRYSGALGMIAVLGAAYVAVLTPTRTTCLARVPRSLQARIGSLFSLTLGTGYAVGLIVQGWLGDRFGARAVPAVAGGLFFVGALVARKQGLFNAISATTQVASEVAPLENCDQAHQAPNSPAVR